ncbi:guide RNA-binding protein of 21 kDa [Trypanosoma cruzi]|uniref:Mitochondrial RNA binding protein 1, putative n=2 Tax=Trypanosoma cruzi TaxID=5693 RepID=Q4DQE1_TRYCC|nr:mitochondrial RNA binding protein 1, putative [Trypanosoma cruzi]EAN94725.1 mitochondrial RNA binding protein 1, putative [Trypanosoma cruzi]PWV19616.1 guide RNA-binding protein of 21 kDa [Trypanosoma cruzi]RNC48726.1 mitochondrial RNA binding protein 1 [Trypanosoma cruzi]|eukprot:XP_816576.1 mitochondrial RNA binding protein 1 [Trypanosoma cruzi strain CL Brener]
MLRFAFGRGSLAHAAWSRCAASVAGVQSLPKFEIHDVRDDPALGTMTRVAVDGKLLLISQYPQLGPRKVDPNDLSPQFDSDRRISVRMRHVDLAGLVCVCQSRISKYEMTNRGYTLVFERVPEGYRLHGQIHRVASQKMEDWSVNFDKHFAVTLEHFLESALTESFGFRQHYAARAADGGAQEANTVVGSASGRPQRRGNTDSAQRR